MSAERLWWYLSFCDPDLAPPEEEQVPGGPSWLGGCYVQAPNLVAAIWTSHVQGCNPGGEVMVLGPISESELDKYVPQDKRNRLLSLEEVNDRG